MSLTGRREYYEEQLRCNRECKKKRKGLGFVPLNEQFEGAEPHHLDKEHVLYVPHKIHRNYWHSQNNQESMDKINEIVIDWYVQYYGLV